jgi:type III pantothenate kinase
MILCIDSGNSRIKWGRHDGACWRDQGVVDQADVARLAALVAGTAPPERVMLANVAGPDVAASIGAALAPWQERITEVRSAARGGGVKNGYDDPARLGVDRWCALVGARDLGAGACLVVMAGTATTIDALAADGRFIGGMILPGLDLMRRALARDTAALPLADGAHVEWPRRTEDAIATGCLEAQIGAIERAWARLPEARECLLAGGAAELLEPRLGMPHRRVPLLVLEGLRRLAGDDAGN